MALFNGISQYGLLVLRQIDVRSMGKFRQGRCLPLHRFGAVDRFLARPIFRFTTLTGPVESDAKS
jgi:hypothetical protein